MKSLKKILIGTAQFGYDYGVTNTDGKVSKEIVQDLIDLSVSNGISGFDTAQSYGVAEKVLGENLPRKNNFKIISKLNPQQNTKFDLRKKDEWESMFKKTLSQLQVKRLDGFLVHSSKDINRPDSTLLIDWLRSLRERKLVKKIGVSIYDIEELDQLPLNEIQILQFPLSIYDQRFYRSGLLKKLKENNIVIIARSIFLQGLILQESNNLPHWVSKEIRKKHDYLIEYAKIKNLSLLEIAIQYILSIKEVDYLALGITNVKEMKCLINACDLDIRDDLNYEQFAINDKDFIDPRRWSKK